jgi:hypothetical protein
MNMEGYLSLCCRSAGIGNFEDGQNTIMPKSNTYITVGRAIA